MYVLMQWGVDDGLRAGPGMRRPGGGGTRAAAGGAEWRSPGSRKLEAKRIS